MQKTQLEKGLKRFTQKFRVEDQAAQKAILTLKSRKEDERPKKHPPPKRQWTSNSTYLENIEPQKCPFLLGQKRATPTGRDASDDALLVRVVTPPSAGIT
jgi:hypothetical protein